MKDLKKETAKLMFHQENISVEPPKLLSRKKVEFLANVVRQIFLFIIVIIFPPDSLEGQNKHVVDTYMLRKFL